MAKAEVQADLKEERSSKLQGFRSEFEGVVSVGAASQANHYCNSSVHRGVRGREVE